MAMLETEVRSKNYNFEVSLPNDIDVWYWYSKIEGLVSSEKPKPRRATGFSRTTSIISTNLGSTIPGLSRRRIM
jgi:hypothetical protein